MMLSDVEKKRIFLVSLYQYRDACADGALEGDVDCQAEVVKVKLLIKEVEDFVDFKD